MPTGRKPTPLKLVDNAKARHTKETLDGRQNGEPEGCTDKLTPPKTISNEAKKEWKRIVKLYRQLDAKIINDLDISTLMAYCESVAIYRRAQEEYQNRPLVYMNADGRPAENPYITIMRREGEIRGAVMPIPGRPCKNGSCSRQEGSRKRPNGGLPEQVRWLTQKKRLRL